MVRYATSVVRISIIIPTYNEIAEIGATLACAARLQPHEIIVVDGGSTDGTIEAAGRLSCRIVHSSPGRSLQQNHGADVATGDVLFFLHADCRPAPDALKQIRTALADEGCAACVFKQRIDASGLLYRFLEIGNALRVRLLKAGYGDQGICVRTSTFEDVGRFPEVRLMEDVLLLRKLRRRGRLALLPGPLTISARRWQKHGLIRQTLRNWSLLAAHRLGAGPDRLARFYRRHDK